MPTINDPFVYNRAIGILRSLFGPGAAFRDGQYEAIEAVMTHSRTLVVQRTGWGKSLVYFTCTRLLREAGKGLTIVVSPLLVLMENQLEAAQALGLRCDVLNSTVKDRRADILYAAEHDQLDLLLVTPETLFTEDVQQHLKNIRIGLFVIDEAHCISDWGHDFRLEYGNLRKIIGVLPVSTPLLATTATANDRVIADLTRQFGTNVYVSRGPLTRESLYLQVLNKPGKEERYAWILENVPKLPGCGIIYCLTQRDCDYLSDFLKKNGISAEAYYSRDGEEGALRNHAIEEQFRRNQLKVIVATIKLGMGYDKGDIAFIIHFQMPSNIVSYYQQIGRAGRNIPRAFIFLMYGKEDESILNYFLDTAFPTETETEKIVALVAQQDGVRLSQILAGVNARRGRIDKALAFLINDGFLRKEKSLYYLTPKRFTYHRDYYAAVTATRRQEMEQMKQLATTKECLSRYIVSCLDDPSAHNCGRCANCLGRELLPSAVSPKYAELARQYLGRLQIEIEPRRMWAASEGIRATKITHINQPGICLCKYGDAGFGELVRRDKYSIQNRFCDQLLGKSLQILRPFVQEHHIRAVTCVPSNRSGIVKDFAERLAASLQLPFYELLDKQNTAQQKEMQNGAFQCANAYRSFSAKPAMRMPESVLLVDDMVDSRWTMTVCGFRLMEAGVQQVYPFALADSSNRED